MNERNFTIFSMIVCLLSPYLSKIPWGLDEVCNYAPRGNFILLVALFSALPGISFAIFTTSTADRIGLPILLSSSATMIFMICAHASNHPSRDAQDSVAFLMIGIYGFIISVCAGALGRIIIIMIGRGR